MTIKEKDPFDLKLLLNLQVFKVRHETSCESTWWVKYKGYDMVLEEEFFSTTEEDEISTKEVKAQIYLMDYEMSLATEKKKLLLCNGGGMDATGICTDIIETEINGNVDISYKLDSVFPMKINDLPKGAKIGDWITVSGEGRLILPRMPNREPESKQLWYFLGNFSNRRLEGLSDDEMVVKYVAEQTKEDIHIVLDKGRRALEHRIPDWIDSPKWAARMLHQLEEEAKKQGKF